MCTYCLHLLTRESHSKVLRLLSDGSRALLASQEALTAEKIAAKRLGSSCSAASASAGGNHCLTTDMAICTSQV